MEILKEVKEQYKKSFLYIKESKNFIYGIIIIFFLFSLIGFFVPLPEEISQQILDYFKEIILKTENYSSSEMIFFLFENNSMATFIGLFSGIFLGIFSVFNAILNGFVLGFAGSISVTQNGISSLLLLVPHGIFELPAVFISLGLGVKLGSFIFKKDKTETLKEYFNNSLKVYFLIIFPLLIFAALIEGFLITL